MACDAAVLAAGPLGLREAICQEADLQAYINLDDSILQQIKMLVPDAYEKPADVIKVRGQDLLKQIRGCAVCRGWGVKHSSKAHESS
jgi:hypothetical protein